MTEIATTGNPLTFLILLLAIIIYLLFRLPSSAGRIGKKGEKKVRRKIEALARKRKIYLSFHDITLSTPDGTTQIDHVVVSPFGIFVIETKNYKGWIFGDINQKKWTITLFRKKYRFQNPLHQNYKHVKAIEKYLKAKYNTIFSIVVFVGDCRFKTEMPANVLKLHELLPYIKSHVDNLLSEEEVKLFSEKLAIPQLTKSDHDRIHIKNLKHNLKNPTCPRCGKPMVLRKASKGPNAGSKFWGCSGFPSCKATKNVA